MSSSPNASAAERFHRISVVGGPTVASQATYPGGTRERTATSTALGAILCNICCTRRQPDAVLQTSTSRSGAQNKHRSRVACTFALLPLAERANTQVSPSWPTHLELKWLRNQAWYSAGIVSRAVSRISSVKLWNLRARTARCCLARHSSLATSASQKAHLT